MVDVQGYSGDKSNYLARLRRIEGQVRGLQRMIEEDRYCIEVITQVASITKALQSVAVRLLDEHIRHCVAEASGTAERDVKIGEATAAIERLLKV